MTLPAAFVGPADRAAADRRYLGSARVTRVGPGVLEARLPSGEVVSPRLALAFPFTPAENDSLLVIGQDERYFVIGVLSSTGETALHFQGNVELRAVDGKVALHGERGVELRGAEVDIKTRRL